MNNQSFDIGRALTFMFEEEEWVMKFVIMTLMFFFSFLIIPAIIMQGYVIEIIRRVGRDERPALPTWDNWAHYLSEGALAFGALIAYLSPIFLLFCCTFIPVMAMADETSGELEGGAALLLCVSMFFIFLLLFPIGAFYSAGLAEYAATRDFGGFFRFTRLWADMRRNSTPFLYAIGIIFLANFVGQFIPFVGYTWSQFATGHALGQYLRQIGREGPVLEEQPPHSTVL